MLYLRKIILWPKEGKKMPFVNTFVSYLLLFLISAVVAGIGIFLGITFRKRKNAADLQNQEAQEAS